MHLRIKLVFVSTLLITSFSMYGCSASAADKPTHKKAASAEDEGRLEVLFVKKTPQSETTSLTFKIRNPFKESVDGVRVLYRVSTEPKPEAPEHSRVQQEFDTHLQAGESIELSLTVPPQPSGTGTFIQAFAIRLGAKKLPVPHKWRQIPPPTGK